MWIRIVTLVSIVVRRLPALVQQPTPVGICEESGRWIMACALPGRRAATLEGAREAWSRGPGTISNACRELRPTNSLFQRAVFPQPGQRKTSRTAVSLCEYRKHVNALIFLVLSSGFSTVLAPATTCKSGATAGSRLTENGRFLWSFAIDAHADRTSAGLSPKAAKPGGNDSRDGGQYGWQEKRREIARPPPINETVFFNVAWRGKMRLEGPVSQ
ncbi:hypothetical protein CC80DRAFT_592235 [Byssothecium circinans]|uniref:Uncharacterized protein n=1 Tax=Byssothecium circinans TaxID=147558 RepID=A0A6A5U9E5_9PLEO|nr:hypothetical protein CC80DRAFT_592235 [Byssothecium circinans]